MSAEQKGDLVHLEVDVENIGGFDGATVLEIFVNAPKSEVIKPLRELRGFEKLYLSVGEKKRASVDIPVDSLRYYIDGAWRLEGGEYVFELCTDANNPVFEASLVIESADEPTENDQYIQLYGSDYTRFLSITDEEYDSLIGMEIPEPTVTRPYDLNTPIRSYSTLGGRMLFSLVNGGFKLIYNLEKAGKETPDKETKVKNAYFSWRTIETMSLRSICYASEGRLSHHLANILLAVANNQPLRALGLLFKPEKNLKLPE
jgi:beta-glucosidase